MKTRRAKREKEAASDQRCAGGEGNVSAPSTPPLGGDYQEKYIVNSTKSQQTRDDERAKSNTAHKGTGEQKRYDFIKECVERDRRAGRDDRFHEKFDFYLEQVLDKKFGKEDAQG
jgi:hypothetical protein